jgi:hypothetical protein
MANLTRQDMEARYVLFNEFALNDQRDYYRSTIRRHREAARQVNRWRALFAFLTGLSAAVAGFIVQANFIDGAYCASGMDGAGTGYCDTMQVLVSFFILGAVATPALGAFFNTLADLYQWDRLITIFDAALENIEVADARSPLPDMDDLTYRASLRAFTEGTLLVMSDETAQWGQSIRVPPQLDQFIEEERRKAERLSQVATRLDRPPDAPPDPQPKSPGDFDRFEQSQRDQEAARTRRDQAEPPPADEPDDEPQG